MVSAHGHGTLTVRVKPSASGGVRIEIADDGPGVPADDLPRIFNPFFTTKPPGEGCGLGLSVAYSIVAEHEGIIRAENSEASGALFTVELPVGAPAIEPSLSRSTAPSDLSGRSSRRTPWYAVEVFSGGPRAFPRESGHDPAADASAAHEQPARPRRPRSL